MSVFKRYQSKVFWNQMEAQDSTNSNSANISHKLQLPCEEGSFEISRDSSDNADVTVIQVYDKNVNIENFGRLCSFRETSNLRESTATACVEESTEVEDVACSIRPYSPISVGHRSQDSGFSDSDRSDCSDKVDGNVSRRRSLPRERRHRHRRTHMRLDSLWLEEQNPPNPAHTSTPKQLSRDRKINLGHNETDITKTRWDLRQLESAEDENEDNSIVQSINEENLGDFLYISEPPEDASPRSSCSRSQGTLVVQSLTNETLCKSGSHQNNDYVSSNFGYLASVKAWLSEIATEVDDECCIALQSKTLPRRNMYKILSEEAQTRDLKTLTSSATAAATKLLVRANKFDQHYRSICEKLSQLGSIRSERELLQSIEDDAFSFLLELGAPPPRRIHQGSLRSIVAQLEKLKTEVNKTLEPRLDFYIERVVRSLEEAPRETCNVARGAIAALTALGLAGTRAGSSIARCSGVRALLTSLISAGRLSSDLRAASLRALASVCCCREAIESFAKNDGAEILADILANNSYPENERTEAAALVVQVTAPWTNALGLPYMVLFADSLVRDLTQLAQKTTCAQTLLLAAAALNNLSSSRKFVVPILEHDTVRRLLQCVKKSTGGNVWLMEQVASLIGEVARVPEARRHLAGVRVSVALVSFLRMRPPGLESAYRRLEATASAALTRLCVDPEIARQIVAVGGADCLPSCNSKDEEVSSDDEDVKTGTLRYTESLRIARREAAEQIIVAKNYDREMLK